MLGRLWDILDWLGRFLLLSQMARFIFHSVKEGLSDSDLDYIILGNLLFYWALLFQRLNMKFPKLHYGKGVSLTAGFDKKGAFFTSLEYRH
jgi:hypothetical protein